MEQCLALRHMTDDGEMESNGSFGSDPAVGVFQSGEEDNEDISQRRDCRHGGIFLAITDWKVWWFAVALAAQVIALAFNQFFLTLVGTLGFDRTVTLPLTAPPWIVASCAKFLNARCE